MSSVSFVSFASFFRRARLAAASTLFAAVLGCQGDDNTLPLPDAVADAHAADSGSSVSDAAAHDAGSSSSDGASAATEAAAAQGADAGASADGS